MAELKTKPTDASVIDFLNQIPDETRRQDCFRVLELMQSATGAAPKLWGSAIIGFGDSHYQYASGREGDWFLIGFSPRKQNITLYLTIEFEQKAALLQKLGKHKTGKACLYINKLKEIDQAILQALIEQSIAQAQTNSAA